MNASNVRAFFMLCMVIVVAAAVGLALGMGAGLTVGIAGTVLLVDAINRGRTP